MAYARSIWCEVKKMCLMFSLPIISSEDSSLQGLFSTTHKKWRHGLAVSLIWLKHDGKETYYGTEQKHTLWEVRPKDHEDTSPKVWVLQFHPYRRPGPPQWSAKVWGSKYIAAKYHQPQRCGRREQRSVLRLRLFRPSFDRFPKRIHKKINLWKSYLYRDDLRLWHEQFQNFLSAQL